MVTVSVEIIHCTRFSSSNAMDKKKVAKGSRCQHFYRKAGLEETIFNSISPNVVA
jgi:hypothetical protein